MGEKINYKLLSLFLMIIFLSLSTVSAETMADGNSFNLNYGVAIETDDLGNNYEDISEENLGNAGSDSLGENINEDNLDSNLNEIALEDNSDFISNFNIDSGIISNSDFISNSILNSDSTNSLGSSSNYNIGDGSDDDSDDEDDEALNTTLTILSEDNWKIYGKEKYIVQLMDEENNPVVNALIEFNIKTPDGKNIYETILTDNEGLASITLDFDLRGLYRIQVSYDGDNYYNPAENVSSNVLFYEKTYIKLPMTYSYRSENFCIQLFSSDGVPLANKKLTVSVGGVKYTKTTDSQGKAYVKMPSDKCSVKLIVLFNEMDYYASSSLEKNLPVYKRTYTKPLVYTILKGTYFKVLLRGTDGKILKKEKVKFTIKGKIHVRITNSKGVAAIKLKIKRNVYKIRYSFGNNGIYGPSCNTSTLNVLDPSGQFKKGLNQNTKKSVKRYLSGGGRAHITKAIRKLAKKLTRKYSTKLEKANAIFNYVRDNLAYSYYPNSRKGAAKTLKYKSGNCCDHANLIVALCRAAKIPARYSHAQGCRFKISGSIEGHVWAQIYVGGRWYSADGTSYRNTLGNIKNWDTRHYYRFRSYRSIPF